MFALGRSKRMIATGVDVLLDLRPGQSFLDICAAPGNKTAQALETAVSAIACDLHLSRARMLLTLGVPVAVVDGTGPLPFGRRFDRILVDAPCTGTGTLARNPEIKWKLEPEDFADLQERQIAILRSAMGQLAPGGLLVYSTCSLEREENEQVVASAVAGLPSSVSVSGVAVQSLLESLREQGRFRADADITKIVSGDVLRTLPGNGFDGDGFFAAIFERQK